MPLVPHGRTIRREQFSWAEAEKGYRASIGILRLARHYGAEQAGCGLDEHLGDHLQELVANLRIIDRGAFLRKRGLDVALHQRRPDVCDWVAADDVRDASGLTVASAHPADAVANIVPAETAQSGLQAA